MLLFLLLTLALTDPWEGFECTGHGACDPGPPMYCWDVIECVEVGVFRDGFD